MASDKWNRCDECGRFIAFEDFERGAVRRLVRPDSDFTSETWETLCAKDAPLSTQEGADGD